MKKILALALALMMVLTTGLALAEGASKGGGDNNGSEVTPAAPGYVPAPGKPAFFFKVTDEPKKVEWANAELARMQEAENYQTYFGQANEIAAILGEPDYAVNEFWPVIAGNYEDAMGDIKAIFFFATPYEKDQDVAVEIGFETGKDADGNSIMAWKTYAGKGQEDHSILFVVDGETIKDIEETGALLAVVSK